jgi:hypothetical protein
MKFILVLVVIGAVGWYYFKPLPPGKGPDAAKGMRISNGVVSAIESYRSDHQMYPPTLEDLIPSYLGSVPHLSHGSSLDYQRLGASFKLTFSYANPVPVHCTIAPGKKWECEWF